MKRWEYLELNTSGVPVVESLDEYGDMGWELVLQNQFGHYVMRREVQFAQAMAQMAKIIPLRPQHALAAAASQLQ